MKVRSAYLKIKLLVAGIADAPPSTTGVLGHGELAEPGHEEQ